MVPFRVHGARPQEDERDVCKCTVPNHTLLLCAHCLVEGKKKYKKGETQTPQRLNSGSIKISSESQTCANNCFVSVSNQARFLSNTEPPQCEGVNELKKKRIWDVLFHESRLRHWHENFHIKGHVPGLWMSQAVVGDV